MCIIVCHHTNMLMRDDHPDTQRAEHNQGMLSSLEEVSLHQLQLTDVSLLSSLCKRLKILYLQANQLTNVTVLGKLKALEYLNIAMNNVWSLNGLQRCESLCKLDLTLNNLTDAHALIEATEVLQHTQALKELFLMGNTCQQQFSAWRTLVVGRLPQLRRLVRTPLIHCLCKNVAIVQMHRWQDGEAVLPSERLSACQGLAAVLQEAACAPRAPPGTAHVVLKCDAEEQVTAPDDASSHLARAEHINASSLCAEQV